VQYIKAQLFSER